MHSEGVKTYTSRVRLRATTARYALAALIVLAFLLVRLALQPWLGTTVPYLQFFPAIMLAARVAGFGPGILATVLSAAAATYFFLMPAFSFHLMFTADRVSVPLFLAVGVALVWLMESARGSAAESRDAAARANARARELDAVFEAIPDGVFVAHGNRITRVNAAGLRMLGAESLDELNSDLPELAAKFAIRSVDTGEPLPPEALQVARALRGESVVEDVVARRLDTGADLFLRSSAAPVRDGNAVVGAVVVNADMTASREAARKLGEAAQAVLAARQRLAEVVANVPGVVYEAWGEPAATSQRIDFVSDYVKSMLGYEPAEWTGTPNFWLTIVHPDDRERAAREAAAIFSRGVPGRSEFRWLHRDGRVVWVEAHSTVILDERGEPVGMRGVTLDITSRKRLEQERAELLAREQTARADAVAANRLKDDFLATLSHELRTPLNAILGYARMLRTGVISGDRQARALEIVERNATHLTQMVEDVLDVSRVMSGKIRLNVERLNLAAIIEDSLATVRPAAEAKGVDLAVVIDDAAGPVAGDADRLQQVVWNLLSNAVRFTPRDGQVQVRLERRDANAAIVVTDTGTGIDPAFLPHVFDRFRQADSRPSREYGGLGLGLAIARDLVQLHGGSIAVASEGIGRGATVTVSLPLTPGHRNITAGVDDDLAPAPPATHEAHGILEGVKVLVVDDDEDAVSLMREVLESAGALVSHAHSASAAMAVLAQAVPDAMVTDLGMPGRDGYALIADVRNSSSVRLRDLPAAALTAYARSEDRMRAVQSGFQMHLSKPIDPAALIAAVSALGRSIRS